MLNKIFAVVDSYIDLEVLMLKVFASSHGQICHTITVPREENRTVL